MRYDPRVILAGVLILIEGILSISQLLMAAPPTTEEQYLRCYLLMQEADRAETSGNLSLAYKDFSECLRGLIKLRDGNIEGDPGLDTER